MYSTKELFSLVILPTHILKKIITHHCDSNTVTHCFLEVSALTNNLGILMNELRVGCIFIKLVSLLTSPLPSQADVIGDSIV